MSVEVPGNSFYQLHRLKRIEGVFKSIQSDGMERADDHALEVIEWLDEYLEQCDIPPMYRVRKRDETMRFFDELRMGFPDWQDMVTLIPLRLAVEGYPDLETLSSSQIKLMLDMAGGMDPDRHDIGCLSTGLETKGCHYSDRICSTKSTYQLGRDLAAQFAVMEIGSIAGDDIDGVYAARQHQVAIREKFAEAGLMTEEDFEEFVNDTRVFTSSYFNSAMSAELPTE